MGLTITDIAKTLGIRRNTVAKYLKALEGQQLISSQDVGVYSLYFIKNPGADLPFRLLTLTEPTENSMGLRLGNMPEIRVIMQEEMEKAFQGQQTAKQAQDKAVERGNTVLRNFERTNKQ